MTVVYVIRHAHRRPETAEITTSTIPLSPEGFIQASEEVGPALRGDIDKIIAGLPQNKPYQIEVYTSPYLRAQQTLEAGVKPTLAGLRPVNFMTRDELRERDIGDFRGLSEEERLHKFEREALRYYFVRGEAAKNEKPPGVTSESPEEVALRIDGLMQMLQSREEGKEKHKCTKPERIIILVTHSYIANAIAKQLTKQNFDWLDSQPGPACGSIRKFTGPTLQAMTDQGFIYGEPEKKKNYVQAKALRKAQLGDSGPGVGS